MAGREVGGGLPLCIWLVVHGEGDGEGREGGVAGVADLYAEGDAISLAEVGALGGDAEELGVGECEGGDAGEEGEGERGEHGDGGSSGHREVGDSTRGVMFPTGVRRGLRQSA